jgi:hypothetical protein
MSQFAVKRISSWGRLLNFYQTPDVSNLLLRDDLEHHEELLSNYRTLIAAICYEPGR